MTSERNFNLHDGKTGSALAVCVTPRARKNELSEVSTDGTLKIRLAVPNEAEPANHALVHYLAELLGLNSTNIEVVAGEKKNNKLVTILGIDSISLQQRIMLIAQKSI